MNLQNEPTNQSINQQPALNQPTNQIPTTKLLLNLPV